MADYILKTEALEYTQPRGVKKSGEEGLGIWVVVLIPLGSFR
jgi:hypothetical protein